MNLVTSAQMAAIDARAQSEFGIPGVVLMESAAKSAWDHFQEKMLGNRPRQNVVFVAGNGNNGGDALVMARYCLLSGDHFPRVLLVRDVLSGDAELQRKVLEAMRVPFLVWKSDSGGAEQCLREADWIVDGLSGTGLTGPLRQPHADIARAINESHARVVSIDAPSGVGDQVGNSDAAVCANFTLTLGLPKRCLYDPLHRGKCGEISLVSFTLPSELVAGGSQADELLDSNDLPQLIPPLAPTAHKGLRGVLAIFAGSEGTTGAAILSARGGLGAGAGLVTIYASEDAYQPLASQLTSVMVRREDESIRDGSFDARQFGAAVVGPGWGTTEDRSAELVQITRLFTAGVVDADGLTLLSALPDPHPLDNWILTPHPGELGRLLGITTAQALADMYGAAVEAAQEYGCVVVAKASTTIIAHPDGKVAVVDGMNPALATAGSGDVLSGAVGALLSRGIPSWDAARAGALLHSAAGQSLAVSDGFFRSEQLPMEIGRILGSILLTR